MTLPTAPGSLLSKRVDFLLEWIQSCGNRCAARNIAALLPALHQYVTFLAFSLPADVWPVFVFFFCCLTDASCAQSFLLDRNRTDWLQVGLRRGWLRSMHGTAV